MKTFVENTKFYFYSFFAWGYFYYYSASDLGYNKINFYGC